MTAPASTMRAISAALKPSSARTSRLCSPSSGAGCAMPPGVAENLTGRPRVSTRPATGWLRSEEHTSELQSLMRISYAVFCLKKKKTTYDHDTINQATEKNITLTTTLLPQLLTH